MDEIAHAAQVDPLHGVQRARREADLREQGVEGGLRQAGDRGLAVAVVGAELGPGGPGEDAAPGGEHLLGVVEAATIVPRQGLGEEGGHGLAQGGLEGLGIQADLVLDHRGVALAIAPHRQGAGGHLVEGDRGGEALGIGVPARGLAQGQEGVEVGHGAGADVLGRGVGQGEVEQHQVQLLALAHECDAEVLGLDVAMGHAFLLQPVDCLEQVLAEALEELEVQPALLAQALGQGLLAGLVHQDADPALIVAHLVQGNDELVTAQTAQHRGLGLEAGVVVGLQGHLEHLLLALVVHQQGQGGGTLAEALLDHQAVDQAVAGFGLERVADQGLGGLRGGDLVFELLELVQEVGHRVEPAGDLGVGAELDQELERLGGTVEHGGDLQALALAQLLHQLVEGLRGRLAGEQVVGERAEGEDIGLFPGLAALRQRLGGHVDGAGLLDEARHVAGHGVAEAGDAAAEGLAGGGLPVEHLDLRRLGLGVDHQDVLGAQGAMVEPLVVGIAHGLGNPPDEVQPAAGAEPLAALAQIVVQALGLRGVVVDQGRTALVLGVALRTQDAGVADAVEDGVLALGGLDDGGPHLRACAGLDHVDAHPGLVLLDGDVGGGPVLVGGPLEQQGIEPVVADPMQAL